MQVMPFIGYVEYRKRCVIANDGKCRVMETASNRQGLDMPSNRNVEQRSRRRRTFTLISPLRFLSCATQTLCYLVYFDVHMNRRNVFIVTDVF